MEILKCLRCKHEWYPRTPKKPKLCPSCKSKFWDEDRKSPSKTVSEGWLWVRSKKKLGTDLKSTEVKD